MTLTRRRKKHYSLMLWRISRFCLEEQASPNPERHSGRRGMKQHLWLVGAKACMSTRLA
jgi:hypothetical protein